MRTPSLGSELSSQSTNPGRIGLLHRKATQGKAGVTIPDGGPFLVPTYNTGKPRQRAGPPGPKAVPPKGGTIPCGMVPHSMWNGSNHFMVEWFLLNGFKAVDLPLNEEKSAHSIRRRRQLQGKPSQRWATTGPAAKSRNQRRVRKPTRQGPENGESATMGEEQAKD